MFRPGDTIENPVTGERVVFAKTSAETNGELVVIETFVQPGGFVATAHMHPHQEERFRVVRGTIGFRAGGDTLNVGPGGQLTVPEGTPHRFWNAGPDEANLVCEVRPALHFEQLLETMFALAAEGKTNEKGLPNVLQLAVIAQAYADTIRLPFPPAWLQRVGLSIAAPTGRLLGYRAAHTGPGALGHELGSAAGGPVDPPRRRKPTPPRRLARVAGHHVNPIQGA